MGVLGCGKVWDGWRKGGRWKGEIDRGGVSGFLHDFRWCGFCFEGEKV